MTNAGFTKIEQDKDVPTLNEYQYQKNHNGDMEKFLKNLQFSCRDNGRTPFQWDSSKNAGFSTGNPWLSVNSNYTEINAAQQEKDSNSILNYFRKIVQLRKDNPALTYGAYTLLDKDNPSVYAYTREWQGRTFLVVLNFTNQPAVFNTGLDISNAKVVIDNYPATTDQALKAYEARVYQF